MKFSRTTFQKVLSVMILICLIAGVATSAMSVAADGSVIVDRLCKSAVSSGTSRPDAKPLDFSPCCFGKALASTTSRTLAKPLDILPCCPPPKIAVQNANTSSTKAPIQSIACCEPPAKIASNINGDPPLPPPCPTPAPTTICDLALPLGSVVGDMPYDTQAFWAPGKISPDVTVSAGTYWVIGVGTADNGDKYYEILLGCEYVFVPLGSMQPSYQPPWNGEALPTTPAL